MRGPSVILMLAFLAVLFTLGLPLFIMAVGLFILINTLRKLFSGPTRSASYDDPRLSPVIDNKNIGPYRVRKDDHDPNIIEVVDRPDKEL